MVEQEGREVGLSRRTIGNLDLDQLVDSISAVYVTHDRARPLWDVWSHALHHAAAIAEEARKLDCPGAPESKLRQEIADFTFWLLTTIFKLRGRLGERVHEFPVRDSLVRISGRAADLLWNRYPGLCPWCNCPAEASPFTYEQELWKQCGCDQKDSQRETKSKDALRERAMITRRTAALNADKRPKSIDQWQAAIDEMYRSRRLRLSLKDISLHLLEEMGEVADGMIRMYTFLEKDLGNLQTELYARQRRLDDELADVFSWLLTLVGKLDLMDNDTDLSRGYALLSQILWDQYGNDEKEAFECRHCNSRTCKCDIVILNDQDQIDGLFLR
ncbi:hypothetical protein DYQ86_20995 [Acidobacteria bacterium AB60]|nr:hypothetical protein DYQ86_20995 [Acidobacteria bacterium AB60]